MLGGVAQRPGRAAPHRAPPSAPSRRSRCCAPVRALRAWPPADVWRSFCEAQAGEWDVVSARFSPDGEPQPLPERVTPQANTDWGQPLYEWRGRLSVQCGGDTGAAAPASPAPGGLRWTHTRFYPVSGCDWGEETASERDGEARTLLAPPPPPASPLSPSASSASFAPPMFLPCTASGSYADAPFALPGPGQALRFEACLVDDAWLALAEATGRAAVPPQRRTRLVLTLLSVPLAGPGRRRTWVVTGAEQHAEARTGGEAAPPEGWAAPAAAAAAAAGPSAGPSSADAEQLARLTAGCWEAAAGACVSWAVAPSAPAPGPGPQRLLAPAVRVAPPWAMEPRPQWALVSRAAAVPGATALALPRGCWLYAEPHPTNGSLTLEAGQMTPSGRLVAQITYGPTTLSGGSATAPSVVESFVLGADRQLSPAMAVEKGYAVSEDEGTNAFYSELLEEFGLSGDEAGASDRARVDQQDDDARRDKRKVERRDALVGRLREDE